MSKDARLVTAWNLPRTLCTAHPLLVAWSMIHHTPSSQTWPIRKVVTYSNYQQQIVAICGRQHQLKNCIQSWLKLSGPDYKCQYLPLECHTMLIPFKLHQQKEDTLFHPQYDVMMLLPMQPWRLRHASPVLLQASNIITTSNLLLMLLCIQVVNALLI